MANRKKFTKETLQKKITEYFNDCDKLKKVYSISGMAVFLGTYRSELCRWEETEEFSEIIKKAKGRIEAQVEEMLLTNKAPGGAIFWLKNFGWSDKQEHELTGQGGTPFTFTVELKKHNGESE